MCFIPPARSVGFTPLRLQIPPATRSSVNLLKSSAKGRKTSKLLIRAQNEIIVLFNLENVNEWVQVHPAGLSSKLPHSVPPFKVLKDC